jgi:hypothetical protein
MLGSLPVEAAVLLRRFYLPARQRQRLKDAFEPERRFLVGFSAAHWFGCRRCGYFSSGWRIIRRLLQAHAETHGPGFTFGQPRGDGKRSSVCRPGEDSEDRKFIATKRNRRGPSTLLTAACFIPRKTPPRDFSTTRLCKAIWWIMAAAFLLDDPIQTKGARYAGQDKYASVTVR